MESLLQQIQPVVQKTAQAIAEVVGVEVEVADGQCVRIAGTGAYSQNVGQLIQGNFIYKHVIATQQLIVIDQPGQHPLCRDCAYYLQCPECAEIAMPVMLRGQIIGVIGLVSFNEQQTRYFTENRSWMIQFIEKMAELLTSSAERFLIATFPKADPKADISLNLAVLEKATIKKVLDSFGDEVGKAAKAAKILGISRATLYRKIQEYHL